MTVDHDGQIRMDCSSPYAMAGLVGLKDRFRVAFANDPDADRHGIVTPVRGADEPQPLPRRGDPLPAHPPPRLAGRGRGRQDAGQQRDDRPGGGEARPAAVRGAGRVQVVRRRACSTGRVCFGGEESAGASFLRHDGTVWTTDKDGLLLALLAAEITARTGKDPGEHYRELTAEFGTPVLHADRRPGHARAEGAAPEAVARGRQGIDAGRRPDHGQADPRPGQRRPDRRAEGGDRGRLVRGPAVRHGGRLQALRGELQGPGAPRRDRRRGAADRGQRPERGRDDRPDVPACTAAAGATDRPDRRDGTTPGADTMSDINDLAARIDGAIAAVKDKMKSAAAGAAPGVPGAAAAAQGVRDRSRPRIVEVAKPRLEALAKRAGDRVKVTPAVSGRPGGRPGSSSSRQGAHITLTFSVAPDRDVEERGGRVRPEDRPGPVAVRVARRVQHPDRQPGPGRAGEVAGRPDRRVRGDSSSSSTRASSYDKAEYVEDPVAKVKFPKFAAGATLEHGGQTHYFIDDRRRPSSPSRRGSRPREPRGRRRRRGRSA